MENLNKILTKLHLKQLYKVQFEIENLINKKVKESGYSSLELARIKHNTINGNNKRKKAKDP